MNTADTNNTILLRELEECIKTNSFDKVYITAPTDIKYLKEICYKLSVGPLLYKSEHIIWINILLSNPFPLKKILNENEIENLTSFLVSEYGKNYKINKFIAKSLALIANNVFGDEITTTTNIFSDKDILMLGINSQEIVLQKDKDLIFLHVILEISKISSKSYIKKLKLQEKDSLSHTRLKLKALSYQRLEEEKIKDIIKILNTDSTKLGWTLIKSILRISKYINPKKLCVELKEKLNHLFANESIWINTAQLLGLFIIYGYYIDVNEIIIKMIFYNNYSEQRAQLIRESGLFLLWACITSVYSDKSNSNIKNNLISKHLNHIIYVSLFDPELNCRQAASTVLLEMVGRIDLKYGEKITDLINFHSVKRHDNRFNAFKEILTIDLGFCEYTKNRIYDTLNSQYVISDGKFISMCMTLIFKCIGEIKPTSKNENIFSYIGYCNLILEFEKIGKITMEGLNSWLIDKIKNLNLKNFYEYSHFDKLGKIYVETFLLSIFENDIETSPIQANIIFLLDKTIEPEKTSILSKKILSLTYQNNILTFFKRKSNMGYILSNTKNYRDSSIVKNNYIRILEANDAEKKSYVIKSVAELFRIGVLDYNKTKSIDISKEILTINLTFDKNVFKEKDETLFFKHILICLDDYSVSINGDIGLHTRKAAFEFLIEYFEGFVLEDYFIQFFTDKNTKLIFFLYNAVIWDNLENNSIMFIHDGKTYRKSISLTFYNFLFEYRNSMTKEENNELVFEKKHFMSLMNSFHCLDAQKRNRFILGLLSTFRNCDGYTLKHLTNIILNQKSTIIPQILSFLYMKGRCLFLSLFFFVWLKENKKEEWLEYRDNIQKHDFGQLDPKKLRLNAMVQYLKQTHEDSQYNSLQ